MKLRRITWLEFFKECIGLTMAAIVSAGILAVLGYSIWKVFV